MTRMNSAGRQVDRTELRRYARRVGERWPLTDAFLGGERVTGGGGAPYTVVLVSGGFDGVPWLERVRQAEALWDAAEMGAPAEVHCYTPVEFERKLAQLEPVRTAAEQGLDLLRP
jgi:uncharacterized protein